MRLLLDLSSLGKPDKFVNCHVDMSIAAIIWRIRKNCELSETEGIFVFLIHDNGSESLPKMSSRLSELGEFSHIKVVKESVFGSLDAKFTKATITKKENSFIATIHLSYYGLYQYTISDVFTTLELAKNYILEYRCQGSLYIS